MSKFLCDNLKKLEEYVPGEQPQDKKYVKLNTNESPYPASEKVVKGIDDLSVSNLRLYCDPTCKKLKLAIANRYNVKDSQVFVSNGSDESLNFIFMAYGQKGVVYSDITYGFYSVFANLYSLKSTVLPLKEDFTLDVNGYLNQNKLIVIANPNAPTGIELDKEKIELILQSNKDGVVVIDEAYVDFGGNSCVDLVDKYDNLIVVQTFSKSRSLAGGRLGFAIANEELIKDLEKIKYSTNPYNVNTLTQIAGVMAIKDDEYYQNNANKIIKTREWTEKELTKMGFLVLDSKANFIFAKSDKISGNDLYLKLKEKGVLIRHFGMERIKDFNRITIGSIEQMEVLVNKVKEILGELK
ncbi:MAG: histidinol-phosphate transaminase [Clostridia bacterium]|nr:histidinol-phosphate transaminase [Clostridia bacterium]